MNMTQMNVKMKVMDEWTYWELVGGFFTIFALQLIWNLARNKLSNNAANNRISHSLQGPFNLPILGYLPFLSSMPHQKFQLLSQKYGPIFKIKLGTIDTIVLNDFESISEAFKKEEFLGRPKEIAFNVLVDLEGLGTLSGAEWKEQKRFTMQQLRNLGLGKLCLEDGIRSNIHRVMTKIDNHLDEPLSVRQLLTVDCFAITTLLFGDLDHRRDQPQFQALQNSISDAIKSLGQISLLTFYPNLAKMIARLELIPKINRLKQDFLDVNTYIKNEIRLHDQSLRHGEPVQDYIDSFLQQMRLKSSAEKSTFTANMLAGNVQGFLAAGIETVKTSLEWALLILAHYPEVQESVWRELHHVCHNQPPSWQHRAQLPFTQATLNECARWKTISPLNLMRVVTDDCHIGQFTVPKGTHVVANLWAVHFDPRHWAQPYRFNPNRFLGIDGQLLRNPQFIPFSIGKRSCPGESMAQLEIFLYLTSLVQRYRITSVPGNTLDETLGLTLLPRTPVYLRFQKRK